MKNSVTFTNSRGGNNKHECVLYSLCIDTVFVCPLEIVCIFSSYLAVGCLSREELATTTTKIIENKTKNERNEVYGGKVHFDRNAQVAFVRINL